MCISEPVKQNRPTFFYNYMQPVMTTGLVEMTQPESPRSPNQKYRLTAKGKMAIFQSSLPED